MKKIIIGLIVILFLSCSNRKLYTKLLYNIEIDYLSTPINDNRDLPNDSIILCFAGNFSNDTIDVYVNNKIYKTTRLITDEKSGMAGDITLPNFKDIENIGVRIDKGKLIFIEPEKKQYNILLDFVNNKVTISFYRKLPDFM